MCIRDSPSVHAAALHDDQERLQVVRAERWIGYDRANDALTRLEALRRWPLKQRMPNLLITGPTNNGKSMIIEKFRRSHPPSHDVRPAGPGIPVVVMQMPASPVMSRFLAALLEASGSPDARVDLRTRPRSATDMEGAVTWWLSGMGARVLIIDELHNMLAGNAAQRREFLNLLRYLGNHLRVSLVGVGTHDAYLAIRSDDQLENRFAPLVLPRWGPDDEQTQSLLASFAASFPLRRPSPIATPAMARYLIERSEGTIGELAALLGAAAEVAITSGEDAITAATLEAADYRGPSERRRAFERALH